MRILIMSVGLATALPRTPIGGEGEIVGQWWINDRDREVERHLPDEMAEMTLGGRPVSARLPPEAL